MSKMIEHGAASEILCIGAIDSERWWRHVHVGGPGHPEVSVDDGL